MSAPSLRTTLARLARGERLSREEAFQLMDEAGLCELGSLAHQARLSKADPGSVTYVKDRARFRKVTAADLKKGASR